ncbi:MAG: ABC transporter permease, partial [Spirochaetae bacterium HGW-Spirochaetae-8]
LQGVIILVIVSSKMILANPYLQQRVETKWLALTKPSHKEVQA